MKYTPEQLKQILIDWYKDGSCGGVVCDKYYPLRKCCETLVGLVYGNFITNSWESDDSE